MKDSTLTLEDIYDNVVIWHRNSVNRERRGRGKRHENRTDTELSSKVGVFQPRVFTVHTCYDSLHRVLEVLRVHGPLVESGGM